MPTIEITDEDRDRIEALREELTAAHAGAYASVDTEDALAYLLDLADAVDDPERAADPAALGGDESGGEESAPDDRSGESDGAATDDGSAAAPFDRDRARDRLESRPRRHGDPDAADEMDLYEIASAFDVTGRSDMTKAELIDAILDVAESLAADPFSWVDVDLGGEGDDGDDADAEDSDSAGDDDNDSAGDDDNDSAGDDDNDSAGDDGQLDAMMSLLDTHDDKWREGDGDARYEVELPDGDVETARTKDDVRALLFKNY
jgi:hypothetical protein